MAKKKREGNGQPAKKEAKVGARANPARREAAASEAAARKPDVRIPPTEGGRLVDPKARMRLNLRQLVDHYEVAHKSKVRLINQMSAIVRGADDPALSEQIASMPEIQGAEMQCQIYRTRMLEEAPRHLIYPWAMGIPGINLLLIAKEIALIRMDGPHCVSCGAQSIPAVYDQLHCWRCHTVPPADAKAGDSCLGQIPDLLKPGKTKDCKRPLTRSHHALSCPNCGNLQHDFGNFSELRTFSGHTPGKNKLEKGKVAQFSQRLRVACFQAFDCMLKAGSRVLKDRKPDHPARVYFEIYEQWRITYAERFGSGPQGRTWLEKKGLQSAADKCPAKSRSAMFARNGYRKIGISSPVVGMDLLVPIKENGKENPKKLRPLFPDVRQHYMAKNKLVDVFLFQFWQQWRIAAGWPWRPLYVHERLGHHECYHASDFSSPALADKKMKAAAATVGAQERRNARLLAEIDAIVSPGPKKDSTQALLNASPVPEPEDTELDAFSGPQHTDDDFRPEEEDDLAV